MAKTQFDKSSFAKKMHFELKALFFKHNFKYTHSDFLAIFIKIIKCPTWFNY
jgi:hypothetical protein